MLKFVLLVVISLFIPILALGQEPAAYTERSKVVPTGEQLHLYGVPTRGADGKIHYLDVLIELEVLDNGQFSPTATVLTEASPEVISTEIVPGTYSWYDVTCEVVTQAINNGRTEAFLTCSNESNRLTILLVTGPVKDHPLAQYLNEIGVDKIPSYEEYTWGIVKSEDARTSTLWGCFDQNDIISAKQIGNRLLLADYRRKNTSDCGADLELATPDQFE